jgi:hypothetical protein
MLIWSIVPPTSNGITLIISTGVLRGAAIFFEFKHYKPKKKKISTRRY